MNDITLAFLIGFITALAIGLCASDKWMEGMKYQCEKQHGVECQRVEFPYFEPVK